ncbi:MAG: hypothetical protein Q9227_003927 [Pyrenula ochraceoflavens]
MPTATAKPSLANLKQCASQVSTSSATITAERVTELWTAQVVFDLVSQNLGPQAADKVLEYYELSVSAETKNILEGQGATSPEPMETSQNIDLWDLDAIPLTPQSNQKKRPVDVLQGSNTPEPKRKYRNFIDKQEGARVFTWSELSNDGDQEDQSRGTPSGEAEGESAKSKETESEETESKKMESEETESKKMKKEKMKSKKTKKPKKKITKKPKKKVVKKSKKK